MASLLVGAPPATLHSLTLSSSRISSSRSDSLGISLSCSIPPSSLSTTNASPIVPFVHCGRGDRRTAKGKRFNHSFGNARPRGKDKGRGPPSVPIPPSSSPPRKDRFGDDDKVSIQIDESFLSG